MTWLKKKVPWYAAGLAFECTQCGQCCSGPAPGYVWVASAEIEALASFLVLSVPDFAGRYVRQSAAKSLIEKDNADCVFLRRLEDGSKRCTVYEARPIQCRTWPFWASNLANPDAWAAAGSRCPGINRAHLSTPSTSSMNASAPFDPDALVRAVRQAQRTPGLLTDVMQLYAELQQPAAEPRPSCEMCGSCCDFAVWSQCVRFHSRAGGAFDS